jgi:hypothetical protein
LSAVPAAVEPAPTSAPALARAITALPVSEKSLVRAVAVLSAAAFASEFATPFAASPTNRSDEFAELASPLTTDESLVVLFASIDVAPADTAPIT